MYDKNGTSVLHSAIVSVICFQINRQECSVPIVSNEHQIAITIAHTATWNVPRNLKNVEEQKT
jgi:hypothetical protein